MYPIVGWIRAELAAHADPAAAGGMPRYMKSAMPFGGVTKPIRERVLRAAIDAHPLNDSVQLDAAVSELWAGSVRA